MDEIDALLAEALIPPLPELDAALEASDAAGLPAIAVSPVLGRLLEVLARARGARRILELGTLGGYSTIWLARGLAPGGSLVSLEVDEHHASVARGNVAAAGFGDVVEILSGPALDTLGTLAGPFDLIFLDADKRTYPEYLDRVLALSAPGTLLIADNVVRGGRILRPEDPHSAGARTFLERLGALPGVTATAIQTVGAKGHDGFAIAVVG